jgi:hypothetical protein
MASPNFDHVKLGGRFSDITTEPRTRSTSVDDYETMPLVSLEEAVEPLILLVPDVRQKACTMKQRCEHPSDNLTPDESAAIMLYTLEWEPSNNSLYLILNSNLRIGDRMRLKPWFLYLKLILTALRKLPPIGNRTVYRGIRLNMDHTYPEGKTFFWQGFSSCTTSINILEGEQFFGKTGTRTLFAIECDSGRSIHRHSCIQKENEVLLLPAIRLTVVACLHQSQDFLMIQLKEVNASFAISEPLRDHHNPVIRSKASESPKKFLSFRNVPLLKNIMSLRTPEFYQNLKLEKTIAICEPRSLINLDRQSLTDQDMPFVVQEAVINKQCTMLRLSDNRITSHGIAILAEALHNNTTLEELYIFNNRVGDKGVYCLAQVLAENNTTLKALSLGYNDITDEGADYLAEMLKRNRTLIELWLPWNRISDRGVQLLANALIQNNTNLKALSFDLNKLVNDSSVDSLIDMMKQSRSLHALHVADCKLSKAGKERLREAERLKKNIKLTL